MFTNACSGHLQIYSKRNNEKFKPIAEMVVVELRCYLGMVSYFVKFMPHMLVVLYPLRNLTEHDSGGRGQIHSKSKRDVDKSTYT